MSGMNGNVIKIGSGMILTAIVTVLIFMGTNVVANDRIRADEDQRIEDKFEDKFNTVMLGQAAIRKDIAVLIDRDAR